MVLSVFAERTAYWRTAYRSIANMEIAYRGFVNLYFPYWNIPDWRIPNMLPRLSEMPKAAGTRKNLARGYFPEES